MKNFSFLISFLILAIVSCSSGNTTTSAKVTIPPQKDTLIEKVLKTNDEWRKILSAEQYRVMRLKGTEKPFTGKYNDHKKKGTYLCAACGFPLFSSEAKFDSGTGWPSFYEPVNDYCILYEEDFSLGMQRNEVMCNRCESHLGHVFEDGPPPTELRYCINSVSLNFTEE